jgi:peptidoglycan/xylan/chitin deacetylase (PgdA/CDA1 family)
VGSAVATEASRRSEPAVTDRRLPGDRDRTLVLTYHAVHPTLDVWQKQKASDRWYAVTANQFHQQMEYILRAGYATSLLSAFLTKQTHPKSVILTFDDGHESNYGVALPILQRFGLRAEFFVTVSRVGQPGFMTWEQLRRLQDAGMSVQSHGLHHRPLTDLPTDKLADELRTAKQSLEHNLSSAVKYLAIPGGFANRRIYHEALEVGHEAVCNSEPGLARPGKIIARVAVTHSTAQGEFEGLVRRKLSLLLLVSAKRKLGKAAKLFLGVQRCEALKQSRLSSATDGSDV